MPLLGLVYLGLVVIMGIRKTFFWLHLIIGCAAAIFIFLMSITGVALTYERQIIKAAERADYPQVQDAVKRLSLEQVLVIAKSFEVKKKLSVSVDNQPNAPFVLKEGRKTLAFINPYTGDKMAAPGKGTKSFFRKLRAFHRWLTLDGSFSETGRWVNGIANLIFFILVLSGIYLWLPAKFKKRAFKQKLVLSGQYKNKQARNYQWHNVFGFYMVPFLAVIIFTAFFFSFKWPGETLKANVSTQAVSLPKGETFDIANGQLQVLSYQQLFAGVQANFPDWQNIQFSPSKANASLQAFRVDMGSGGEPQKRVSVALDRLTGEPVATQEFADLSTYMKVRSYIRFLHTGEVYGLLGQTLAGIASLLACLLVYTGIMLSVRRWQLSHLRKSQLKKNQQEASEIESEGENEGSTNLI